MAQLGRKLHLGRNTAHQNASQSPNSPSDSLRRHASLHNIGYRFTENVDTLINKHDSHDPSSQASYGNVAAVQNQQTATSDDGEELDPALLGSFDYHNFLSCGSTHKTALATSPTSTGLAPVTSTPSHSSNINADDFSHSRSQSSVQSASASAHCSPATASALQHAFQQHLLV